MTSNLIISDMNKALKVIPNKVDKSILLTIDKPFFSLIWLHGLGDSSAGFLDYYQMKSSSVYRGARVKLLQAPLRKVTCNGGDKYNSWYDIKHFNEGKDEDRYSISEIKDSMAIIDKKVQEEVEFWKESGLKESDEEIYKRIFVGGFSQGCAMSLCYGLNSDKLLGGIVGFSGHLFDSFEMKNKTKIPMLVYHGDEDTVLRYAWVKDAYNKHLKNLPNFTFKLIEGLPHSVNERQLAESTQWIMQTLQKNGIKP